jgi:hypothetical protein
MPGSLGFSTLDTEWGQLAQNDVSGLGSHSLSCNFSWSPVTTPASGCIVQDVPVTSATYFANGTFINGCIVSDSVNIVVNDSCDGREERTARPSGNGAHNNTMNTSVYPNPFSDITTIDFNLVTDNKVYADIMDINGKSVTVLYSGNMQAGQCRLNWNGNGASGSRMAQGVYICRIMIGTEMTTVRLLLQ